MNVRVRLHTTPEQTEVCRETIARVNQAMNSISLFAWERRLFGYRELKSAVHDAIKRDYGIASRMIKSCIQKVSGMYRNDSSRLLVFPETAPVRYDHSDTGMVYWKPETQMVSLWTAGVRLHVLFTIENESPIDLQGWKTELAVDGWDVFLLCEDPRKPSEKSEVCDPATFGLIEGHLWIVDSLSRKMAGWPLDRDELESVGYEALIRCVPLWKGKSSFSSYAYRVVSNRMLTVIQEEKTRVGNLLFYENLTDDSEDAFAQDFILLDDTPSPEAQLLSKETTRMVREALETLTPLQRRVLIFKYGLYETQPLPYRALREAVGVKRMQTMMDLVRESESALKVALQDAA